MPIEHSLPKQRRYMSEKQTGDYIGVSVKTLQRLRGEGTGPKYIKLHGRVLYDIQDLDHWLENRKVMSTSEYL